MKNILRYTAVLFYVVLALTSCLPEEPVHESINMGAGEVTSLSSSAADLLCEIEDELPKYTKIEYGIIYSDNQEKVENHKGVKKIEGRDLSENRFLVQLTDLKAKQEYFYCSYLRLDEGRIIYGDISSFVTKASYKVTFNANGGKGGMEPQHFEEDDNKALTENTFTREGHEFAGWNTKADGSGQYFHPQQAHQLTDNVNLFAQWQVVSGMEEGYTYVDLGLSVEWATRNVGAERREAYGDYFAWGETQTKNNYAWDSYQWGIASDLLTKYCVDAAHGKNGATDGKTTLDLTDDAARVQWKGAWRMPTLAEQKELREKCTWKWKNLNGIAGYEVTGPSGKSIFLPAAGFKNNDALYQQGSYGCYWSSSLYEIQSDYAYYLNIIPSTREQGQYSRSYGYSVRPVYTTYYCLRFDANGGSGKMDSMMVKKTETATLPANTFTRDGYIFTAWNTAADGSGTKVTDQAKFSPTSDTTFYAQWHKVWMLHFDANGGKGTMDQQIFEHGIERQLIANTFTREGFLFGGWNTAPDGSGTSYSDKQIISVTQDLTLYAQWFAPEYVDLGLPSGIKWATCNVGATTPEGYGDYFAWGETSPKDNYSWSTYKYCNGSSNTMTKYCTKSSYGYNGFTDGKTTLDLSDDAARANWGGKWRMPTTTEQRELINNCTWTWTTQNGVKGYKVASKTNGNSVFLPAAGYRDGTSVYNVGSYGYYWARSLYGSNPGSAYFLNFNSGNVDWSNCSSRYYGRTVRAVCP